MLQRSKSNSIEIHTIMIQLRSFSSISSNKILLLLILMGGFSLKSYSQSPNKETTIDYLNRLLGLQANVDVKQNTIIIKIKNENGEIIREDKAQIPDLQTEVYYEQETGMLCIPCMKDAEFCVTRVLTIQKIKKTYGRITLPAGSQEKFASLKKGIEHLIKMQSEVGYKEEILFDE